MELLENTTIGEIVAEDYRTATLFSNLGIDFCCKGYKTLTEVTVKKNLDLESIKHELQKIMQKREDVSVDFKSWEIDLLADYIEKTHHRYVEEKTQVILLLLNKLCKVHGHKHAELFQIQQLFTESAQDLAAHMKKEELILFPFIRKMVKAKRSNQPLETPHFGSVNNPIEMMMEEHENEGDRFRKIAELTNEYQTPSDGCTTYHTTFNMLADFEKNLHQHIHLENNILFPSAVIMEKTIS